MRRIRSMISGIGAVDGELQAAAKKRIGRFAGHRFQRQHAIAPGGLGVLHHFLDDMLDVGFLVEQPFFHVIQRRR